MSKSNTLDYRNTNCFTIFVLAVGTLGELRNDTQNGEYHIVPWPHK